MLQMSQTEKRKVLVVDSQASDTNRLARELPRERYDITHAEDVDQAALLMGKRNFDVALIEVDMPRMRSLNLLRAIRREHPMTRVIMMTEYGDEELWVDVMNEGACDLIAKPVLGRDLERQL